MKLEVENRRGKPITTLEIPQDSTLADLRTAFDKQLHYYPERQRWTFPDGTVVDEGLLTEQGVKENSVLQFKDLGIQIRWRLVFVLEYLGPILIAPAFFYWGPGRHVQRSLTQIVAMWLMVAHFLKRELETLFIHRFSHGTMPLQRLPINCFHYWVLCGLAICYFLFHPKYRAPHSGAVVWLLAGAMIGFEALNFQTHLTLRKLRPRGSTTRAIPYGWGFDMVSCANYFWEICTWTMFALLTNTLTAWLFLAVSAGQMTEWARKKHANYRKQFKNYPPNRKALFPCII